MGTAHAGHDQCAHCFYTYIKPALQAERQEMKRRRQIKRLHLSPENRSLISEVDLKEPQMLQNETPLTIRQAVIDQRIHDEVGRAVDDGKDPFTYVEQQVVKVFAEDPEHSVAIAPTARRRFVLNDDTELELGRMYEDGLSYKEIERRTGANPYHINTTVKHLGLTPRGRPGQAAKEIQLPTSTPPVSAPAVEAPPPNGMVSGLDEWTVTYEVLRVTTESKTVAARNFTAAAKAVEEALPEGDRVFVISVTRVTK